MNRTRPNEVAIELNAVLVALIDDAPQVLTLRGRRAAALRSVRGRSSDPADRPARLGRAPDPSSAGLCRAALHLRRPQPRGGRIGLAHRVDLLSRADARAGGGRQRASRAGRAGIATSPGRIGATARPGCWPARSCRGLASGSTRRASRRSSASGDSASTAFRRCGAGTRSWCCSATSCSTRRGWCPKPGGRAGRSPIPVPGEPMRYDHRRILATGIARLRAKIKYRPVVFELMPPASPCCSSSAPSRRWPGGACTSRTSAAWSSSRAWSRRPARCRAGTGGRPAKLYRFRREVLLERAVAGTKLPLARRSRLHPTSQASASRNRPQSGRGASCSVIA